MPALRDRLGALRRDPRERIRLWRMHYFVDVCRLLQVDGDPADALRRPDGAGEAARARPLRACRPVGRAARAASARAARASSSRGDRETLGAEWMLLHAFAWRRRSAATARDRPQRALRLDAVPPPALDPAAGRDGAGRAGAARDRREGRAAAARGPRRRARRVNLLIPTIDLRHFFGGYIAKLNLARRLAERGLRVRVVTVDPVGSLPRRLAARRSRPTAGWTASSTASRSRSGASRTALEVSRADRFIATTWWTAHIADAARRELGGERFLYLIQEYEPFTFPMGTYAALADASYRLPHTALFSTELLRDWFRLRGLGVFASGARRSRRVPERDHADRPARRRRAGRARDAPAAVLRAPGAARGAQHVRARRARARSRRRGRRARRLDARRASGRCRRRRRLDLGGGASLELLPRAAQGDYARTAARARRRPRADVHAAPEPRPARDGLGGDADRHQHVREQDRGGARRDLAEPDRRGAGRRRGRRRRSARRSRARATPSGARRAAASPGAATGTRRSTTRCSTRWSSCFNDRDPGGPGSREFVARRA